MHPLQAQIQIPIDTQIQMQAKIQIQIRVNLIHLTNKDAPLVGENTDTNAYSNIDAKYSHCATESRPHLTRMHPCANTDTNTSLNADTKTHFK